MNNPTPGTGRFAWIPAAIVLTAIGAALCFGEMHYAHVTMGMHGAGHDQISGMGGMSGMSGMGGMNMGGMSGMSGMGNMSGMRMGNMGGTDSSGREAAGTPSGVPGYAEVQVSP